MRWLLFLSRVAFLSGVMLIPAFGLLFYNRDKEEPVSSAIITAGFGLALIMIPLANLIYLILTISGKKITVPRWIILFNTICFIVLLLYFFNIEVV
ncbi:MAG: hypothetical protein ABS67_02575 [Niabella sp. SCN 42-15]|nr:MAG: hypothetical protein ABS67_02575 [Niabella sp. SCN 42-15]